MRTNPKHGPLIDSVSALIASRCAAPSFHSTAQVGAVEVDIHTIILIQNLLISFRYPNSRRISLSFLCIRLTYLKCISEIGNSSPVFPTHIGLKLPLPARSNFAVRSLKPLNCLLRERVSSLLLLLLSQPLVGFAPSNRSNLH